MKDDPNEVAMISSQDKPSALIIACIFLAAAVIGVLLLFTPDNGIFSAAGQTSCASTPPSSR